MQRFATLLVCSAALLISCDGRPPAAPPPSLHALQALDDTDDGRCSRRPLAMA